MTIAILLTLLIHLLHLYTISIHPIPQAPNFEQISILQRKNYPTMSNLVDVTSPDHFKTLLSADLNRVSCLNFWAPWAEPCAAFTEVVKGEAPKFSSVLFLNVSQIYDWRSYSRVISRISGICQRDGQHAGFAPDSFEILGIDLGVGMR
jgi:thiol-disulfide isomerase/thioredoxin